MQLPNLMGPTRKGVDAETIKRVVMRGTIGRGERRLLCAKRVQARDSCRMEEDEIGEAMRIRNSHVCPRNQATPPEIGEKAWEC